MLSEYLVKIILNAINIKGKKEIPLAVIKQKILDVSFVPD